MILFFPFLVACQAEKPTSESEAFCALEEAPLRRLTQTQYQAAVVDLLSVDVPASITPQTTKGNYFRTWAVSNPLSPTTIESFMQAAEYVVQQTDITVQSACDSNDPPCMQAWIKTIAAKAYRRSLYEEEQIQLELFFNAGIPTMEATELSLLLILQHPAFLYYDGLPTSRTPTLANSDQIATRLSFFLRNAPPDEELRILAAENQLQDQETIVAQARRLAQSTEAYNTLQAFHYDWLNLYHLDGIFKNDSLYPDFGSHSIDAMVEETNLLVTETLWSGSPYFETLLLTQRSWQHPDVAATYGGEIPVPNTWSVTELPEDRLGVLTRSAFLSAHASAATSSPVRRGAFVLQELLCEELSPPPEVDMEIPPPSGELPTIRERLSFHSADPSCSGCHNRIDPVGYAFEHFGAMGEWRDTWEGGQAVDASGTLDGSDFHDATELISFLATSPRAQRCYAKKWMEYALGRPLSSSERCTLEPIQERFVQSGGNIQQLLIDISTSDAFLFLPMESP